jgi:triacylglycerol lipase
MADSQRDMIRHEAQVMGEIAALARDPIFYGRGVPRGDGRLVLVTPGLFGNDVYLQPLRTWLGRIGYRPVRSTLMMNAGCPQRLREQVESTLTRQIERHPGPVALIGHSRGGMLCWAIASQLQDRASHLVLLGSPAPAVVAMMRQGLWMKPGEVATSSVADAGARAMRMLSPECDVPHCGCAYTVDLRRPLSPATHVMSVFSHEDPVVRPSSCRAPDAENVEVRGTHSGLVYNRRVLPHVARFLAEH